MPFSRACLSISTKLERASHLFVKNLYIKINENPINSVLTDARSWMDTHGLHKRLGILFTTLKCLESHLHTGINAAFCLFIISVRVIFSVYPCFWHIQWFHTPHVFPCLLNSFPAVLQIWCTEVSLYYDKQATVPCIKRSLKCKIYMNMIFTTQPSNA
jgi:hypothetical protein